MNQPYRIADGGGVEHHRDNADQEQQHRALSVRLQLKDLAAAQAYFPFGQTLLVHRVVLQFAAEEVTNDGGQQDGYQRYRNTDSQQRQVAHAHRFKDTGEEHHRRGNRRGGNRNLRGHHGDGERAGRADALFFRHFGNHR